MVAKYELFVNDAQKVSSQSGVPTSVILAQIILESSGKFANGLSNLGANYNNLFGVKGTGTGGSIKLPTTEYVNGRLQTVNANFRVYKSTYDSILDHSKVLQNSRYTQHTANAKTVSEYIDGIAKGGYATDPNYASKLKNIVSSYNLTKYDTSLPKGYTRENTHDSTESKGSTSIGSSTTVKRDNTSATQNDLNFAEKIFFGTSRVVVMVGLVIVMLLFFVKAFPTVGDVVPTNAIKKGVKSVVK